jgi:hypothetical protein
VGSSRAAILPFVITRVVVLAALAVADFLVRELHPTGVAGARALGASHAGLFAWDATWYRRIAEVGYGGAGRSSLRFFPLYPLAGRYLGYLVSDRVALIVLANLCSFGALVVLHRLLSREQLGEKTAASSLWVLSLFPAAFVLVMGYSEGLLLLLSISCFYLWRTGRPAWAILPAFLAGLARPVGALLFVPALVEAVIWWRSGRRNRGHSVTWAASVLAAPAGMASYLGWVAARYGDFFLPLSEQTSASHRGTVADPLATVGRDFGYLFSGQHFGTALHAPFVLFFVVLLVYGFSRLPASYSWYAAATVAVAVTAPNLDSFERYGLSCFPLAVALACLTRWRPGERLILSGLGAILFACALLSFLGLYVP